MLTRVPSLLIAGLLVFSFCSNPSSTDAPENTDQLVVHDKDFEIGKEFKLDFGEKKYDYDRNLKIKFTEVVDEYRCPLDVMCFWAGNAEIKLLFQVSGVTHEVILNTHRKLNNNIVVEGYEIKLNKLNPYPKFSDQPIPKKDYSAILVIEELVPEHQQK